MRPVQGPNGSCHYSRTHLQRAARAVRNVCKLWGARTAGKRAHWILAALQRARFSLLDWVLEATQTYPAIAPYISVRTCSLRNPAQLQIMLEGNLRMSFEDRIAEVRSYSEMPEYQRTKQIDEMQRWPKKKPHWEEDLASRCEATRLDCNDRARRGHHAPIRFWVSSLC